MSISQLRWKGLFECLTEPCSFFVAWEACKVSPLQLIGRCGDTASHALPSLINWTDQEQILGKLSIRLVFLRALSYLCLLSFRGFITLSACIRVTVAVVCSKVCHGLSDNDLGFAGEEKVETQLFSHSVSHRPGRPNQGPR